MKRLPATGFEIFYRMEPRAMVPEGFAYGEQGRRDFR
jgi:hypothetical protein